jgi:DNA-binding CsgD family transcriptional regulator
MTANNSDVLLWGREREQATLGQLLFEVRSGHGQALVLCGEPGIGKTALLDDVISRAAGMSVMRVAGVQSEVELAYGALQHLWSQLADAVGGLPELQQAALRVMFGLEEGSAANPVLLGVAMLNGLSVLAERQPVLLVIDDAQWLDRGSSQLLAFVARRVQAGGVGLVFSVRESIAGLEGLPMLPVAGIAPEPARRLLMSVLHGPVQLEVLDRFIAETRGNPLALLELSGELTAGGLERTFDRRDSRGLWLRLEESFRGRVDALPEDARQLLLIAAAEPIGDPVLLWRAAHFLGLDERASDAVAASDLMSIGARVRFRHPLVRSSVYRFSSLDARRSAHRALAEATDPAGDPDRRVWHRALATSGSDETVATELEHSASRARARGGLATAAAFLERALTLTADFERRPGRALAAAEARVDAGDPRSARELLSIADQSDLDAVSAARLEVLQARIAALLDRGRNAPGLLVNAARRLEALDPADARNIYMKAMRAALLSGRFTDGLGVAEVAQAALSVAGRGTSWPLEGLLDGVVTLFAHGFAPAAPLLKRFIGALREDKGEVENEISLLELAGIFAPVVWDDDGWEELTQRRVERIRAAGALDLLPTALGARAGAHLLAGEFAEARSLVDEMDLASDIAGTPRLPYTRVALAVNVAPADEALSLIESCFPSVIDRGEGLAFTSLHTFRATLLNAVGRYDEAWESASLAYEDPLIYGSYLVPEVIEAAVRSARAEEATRALEDLAAMAIATGSQWAIGTSARCRALVSEGKVAERLYRDSIDRLRLTRRPIALARTHLLYGEWLRRESRRVDAREQLRTAQAIFDAHGCVTYRDRTTRELAASGETARKRSSDKAGDVALTARESEIARLAAQGLSNREIGERLFISHRTVGYHLASIFTKVGVAHRAQLHSVLD